MAEESPLQYTRDENWLSYHCKCGCGITVNIKDKNCERFIQDWIAAHKCDEPRPRRMSR